MVGFALCFLRRRVSRQAFQTPMDDNPDIMASVNAHRSIVDRGFWKLEHAPTGERVDNIVKHGYKLEHGLELCDAAVFNEPVSKT